ncbi:MAG: carbon monoxide dehydrogenase accessory protein CooC [Candidatus Methanofastidiosia archaeon]|jgi:CO dehydrogenase maturation factor
MKIAVAGKGGVGKTTLSAVLAKLYKDEGRNVLAIDADSNPNLSTVLGIPLEGIVPLTEQKELIENRTKTKLGGFGAVFKLNPKVDDIAKKYAVEHDNIKLLVMGTVRTGESGCACPANILVKSLLTHLLVTEKDVIICDMEAGVEHLGRGTAKAVDAMVIVVEPGQRSVKTANHIYTLAQDLGIQNVYAVGNKVRTKTEKDFITKNLDMDVLGFMPYDERIIEADMKEEPPFFDELIQEVENIKENLEKKVK